MPSVHWGDVPTWLTAIGAFVAASIAFNQLKGQRRELARQAAEQARIAELQTKQLEQLNHQASALRRAQAEQVAVERIGTFAKFSGVEPEQFEAVRVENGSERPIRNLRCRLTDGQGAVYASHVALPTDPPWRMEVDSSSISQYEPIAVLYMGRYIWFLWKQVHEPQPTARGFRLRFDDDAGNAWELDQHMHLAEPTDSDW